MADDERKRDEDERFHSAWQQALEDVQANAMAYLDMMIAGGGLIRITIDRDAMKKETGPDAEPFIPIFSPRGSMHWSGAALRSDIPYFALCEGVNFDPKETTPEDVEAFVNTHVLACPPDGAAIMYDEGQSEREAWNPCRVTLMDKKGEPTTRDTPITWIGRDDEPIVTTFGEVGLDPERLHEYEHDDGSYVCIGDLLDGIHFLLTFMRVSDIMQRGKTEAPKAVIPRQDARPVVRQFDPNDKVANTFFPKSELLVNAEEIIKLDVASRQEKAAGKAVDVIVAFSTEEGVTLSRPIGGFDREVHRAVSSIWEAGNRKITPQQIAKAVGIRNPSRNQIEQIRKSIELQRSVRGSIDFSEEARDRELALDGEPITSMTFEGQLIAADKTEIRTRNGRVCDGYELLREPLIYKHARLMGQVVTYPSRWLEYGEGSDTETNVQLRGQLLRQVMRIKHPRHKGSGNIRFTTDKRHPDDGCLLEKAGVDQNHRPSRDRAIKFALSILDDLKADEDGIRGYKKLYETRGGRKVVYGVTINP